MIMEEKTLYGFNSSQDVIHLQTKYSLWSRVVNIVFGVTFENGFDKEIMAKALDKLFERNDALRITFVKKDKEIVQYFADERHIGNIPSVEFPTASAMTKYINKFRKTPTNAFKGDVLRAVFTVVPGGKQMLLCKVSHFVADTFGLNFLVADLKAVYDAMVAGKELPAEPKKFEDVLKKDIEYKSNVEATEKDRIWFEEYFKGKQHPTYCGIHGNNSDEWLKNKNKGRYWQPYLFVKCDTEGYRFTIPAAVTEKAIVWCNTSGIHLSTFFFYSMCVAASLLNDRCRYQAPLELLNCRATLAERNCAGTKVTSISVYTEVDYEKSFEENIKVFFNDQSQIYRHTRLSYLAVENIEHTEWKDYSRLGQVINFSYSYIPVTAPEGVSVQVFSNGKGALPAYVALMHDTKTNEITTIYDIQTKMTSPQQLVDYQNTFIHVAETVLNKPTEQLKKLF